MAVPAVLLLLAASVRADDVARDPRGIVREAMRADTRALVAANLDLTDAEAKAFWPVYDGYQAELAKINERLKAGIDAYAKDYNANTMTDAKASALITEMIAIEEALVGLKKTYAAKLNGVIPATKIARYIQVENKVRALVNYELAAGIPFVK